MKRRLLMVAGLTAVLVASAAPVPGMAWSPERFGRVDTGRRADLSTLTALRKGNRPVMVAVELDGRPVAAYEAAASATGGELSRARKATLRTLIARRQAVTKRNIQRVGGDIEATYTDVFNGFRVSVRANKLDEIARMPGVRSILAVPKHTRLNANTVPFIGADRTWARTGFTGKGVKVAIIDSGINYYHADFNGAGYDAWRADDGLTRGDDFPTAKVVGGWDLVGDDYDPDNGSDIPQPDPDPLDCKRADAEGVQHGTHVAGTAAGFGVTAAGKAYKGPWTPAALDSANLRIGPGVAPEASLLAYRVFGCDGGTYLVIDAIEMAVRSGADIINMSLGGDFGNPGSLDSIAADNASLAGVTIVAASGNYGPSAYDSGSPAASQRSISVGAVDAERGFPAASVALPSGSPVDAINANGGPLPVTGKLRYFVDDPNTPGDADTGEGYEQSGCKADAYAYNGFQSGEIAVVQRGFCGRVDKAKTGDKKQAAAVIMVNNASSLPPYENAIAGVQIPFVGVSEADDGRFEAADGKSATVTAQGRIKNPHYADIAEFSSMGPGRVRNLVKPDVVAPGVSVFSADGATVGQGKALSGTSMATPAVAGVAALVLEAHPSWEPRTVKAAIMGTASAGKVDDYEIRAAGAGVVQPLRAVDTKAYVLGPLGASSLTFGYQEANTRPGTSTSFTSRAAFTIVNTSTKAITYDLVNDFRTASYGLKVRIQPSRITIPARSRKNVTVAISMSAANAGTLPSQAPKHGSRLQTDPYGQLFTAVTTVAGTIKLNPRSSGAGIYQLGVPWLVVPRGESRIQDLPSSRKAWTTQGTSLTSSLDVRNYGAHSGRADVFAWGLMDGEESTDRLDLRAGGVQSLPAEVCDAGAKPSDRCLVFALNLWGSFNNAAEAVYEVVLDVDGDGTEDFIVSNVDLGVVFGTFNGVAGSAIYTWDGDYVNAYFAGASTNGSTVLLPVLASDLGLKASGDRNFRYYADSWAYYDDFGPVGEGFLLYDLMTTGIADGPQWAQYDAWDPVLDNGAIKLLKPGDTKRIGLSLDRDRYAPKDKGQKGWMIVSLDDENGRYQAELIPVGPLPAS